MQRRYYVDSRNIAYPDPDDFEVIKGRGVKATVKGFQVLLGNKLFMEENGLSISEKSTKETETVVYLAVGNKLLGIFHLSDTIRTGAKEMIEELKNSGVSNIVMLTGDNLQTAKNVAEQLGIND